MSAKTYEYRMHVDHATGIQLDALKVIAKAHGFDVEPSGRRMQCVRRDPSATGLKTRATRLSWELVSNSYRVYGYPMVTVSAV